MFRRHEATESNDNERGRETKTFQFVADKRKNERTVREIV